MQGQGPPEPPDAGGHENSAEAEGGKQPQLLGQVFDQVSAVQDVSGFSRALAQATERVARRNASCWCTVLRRSNDEGPSAVDLVPVGFQAARWGLSSQRAVAQASGALAP